MSIAVPHYIYRCYDADGLLLYIGCTSSVKNRIRGHKTSPKNKASRWLQACMDRYEVDADRYPNKQEARDAEDNAIRDEQPLFNTQGRGVPTWQLLPRVAEYLIDQGYRELAIETACTCWGEFRDAGVIDPSCAAHIAERRELSDSEMAAIFEGTYADRGAA